MNATLTLKRFSISLMPLMKMMRVSTSWGGIADGVLALRGTAPISDDYFTSLVNIHTLEGNPGVIVLNPQKENLLQIQVSDVTFWRSAYLLDANQLSLNQSFDEFLAIWVHMDELIHMRDIRSVSMSVSFELAINSDADVYLFSLLKNRRVPVNPKQFRLQYQSRKWLDQQSDKTTVPSLETDAFLNESFAYYSGKPELPAPLGAVYPKTTSDDKKINIELDIRRFYSPLMESGSGSALRKQFEHFHRESDRHKANLQEDLKADGVSINE